MKKTKGRSTVDVQGEHPPGLVFMFYVFFLQDFGLKPATYVYGVYQIIYIYIYISHIDWIMYIYVNILYICTYPL